MNIVKIFSDVDQYVTNMTGWTIPHTPIVVAVIARYIKRILSVAAVDAIMDLAMIFTLLFMFFDLLILVYIILFFYVAFFF